MGMPTITPGNRTQEQVMTDLIESIAMQERALSHIVKCRIGKNAGNHQYGYCEYTTAFTAESIR